MEIKKSKLTGKMWVVDSQGSRITPKEEHLQIKRLGVFCIVTDAVRWNEEAYLYNATTESLVTSSRVTGYNSITSDLFAFKFDYSPWCHLYSSDGQLLKKDVYCYHYDEKNKLLLISTNGVYTYYDENLNPLSGEFKFATKHDEFGYARVEFKDGSGCAIINTNMEIVVGPIKCSGIAALSGEHFKIWRETGAGLIDKDGKEILPCYYDEFVIKGEYVIFKNDGKCGLAELNGKIIFDCIYPEIIETHDKFVVQDFAKLEVSKNLTVNK